MQTLLFNLSNFMVNGLGLLGTSTDLRDQEWYSKIVGPILDILNALLVPLLIIVGTAGSIYAVVLGVNFSRAETADKREEAKKRMINAIIGLVAMILLLVILWLFTNNAEAIINWIRGIGTE